MSTYSYWDQKATFIWKFLNSLINVYFVQKPSKARKRNPKSKAEIIDKDDSSSSEDKEKKSTNDSGTKKKQAPSESKKENELSDISDLELDSEDGKSGTKAKGKSAKKQPKDGKSDKKPVKSKGKKKVDADFNTCAN